MRYHSNCGVAAGVETAPLGRLCDLRASPSTGAPGGSVGADVSGKDLGTGALVTLTKGDEVVSLTLAGGAGYGDPKKRSFDAIDRDLAEGYVTPEGAARDYGVVIGADGRIDRKASDKRRLSLRSAAQ